MKKSRAKAPSPKEVFAEKRVEQSLETKSIQLSPKMKKLVIIAIAKMGQATWIEMCQQAGYKVGENSKMSVLKKKVDTILGGELAELNITQYDLASGLATGLQAMKSIVVDKQVVEVPDHAIRLKYIECIAKMNEAKYFPKGPIKFDGHVKHAHSIDAPAQTVELVKNRMKEIKGIKAEFEVVDERAA